MPGKQRSGRNLKSFVLPEIGKLQETGDPWEPYQLLDSFGILVEPVTVYMKDLMTVDSSELTLRSYGMDLLRWWRFLWAFGIEWDRVVRDDARDLASPDAFVWLRLYQEEAWKKDVPRGPTQPLRWTLRRPWRPLEYDAARMMFHRANALLGGKGSQLSTVRRMLDGCDDEVGGRMVGDRLARVRLARQRPTPARIRERRPIPATQGWLSRVPWTQVGTIAGVVAAIGSLLFTAIATYYGAVVSADQLTQSRDDAEREERAQATRVSFWVEQPPMTAYVNFHIANRSPDPITKSSMSGPLTYWRDDRSSHQEEAVLEIGDLAPCTEIVYKGLDLVLWTVNYGPDMNVNSLSWDPQEMTFTDSDGLSWRRDKESLRKDLFGDSNPPKSKNRHVSFNLTKTGLKVEKSASCGE
ncbi:hypothetical protein ACIRJM_09250 [Streptomyces sp. NPDC102405]|uniref:hypothetical protein n=1 Tax=Streptomyces sp. NPDC102405 TaxID=3366170 RepID=UPI0038080D21